MFSVIKVTLEVRRLGKSHKLVLQDSKGNEKVISLQSK